MIRYLLNTGAYPPVIYLARVSIPDKIILGFSLELLSELLDEDVVSSAVHVFGDEEEHEPVPDVRPVHQVVGLVLVGAAGLPRDEAPPQARHGDQGHDVDCVARGQDGQDDEPEPERDVDLLVDDVQAENTEGVELHDGAG